MMGFDISDNNTIKDWVHFGRVASFLYIKLNEGTNPNYPSGALQWKSAWAQRIPAGAYHFAQFHDDPAASAAAFAVACERVGALHATQWNLIPCVDMETMGSADATDWLKAFEVAFRDKTSYTGEILIYASLSTFTSGQIMVQPTWRTWVAEWNGIPTKCSWPGAAIHQYKDDATSIGFSGFDVDWALVSLDELHITD